MRQEWRTYWQISLRKMRGLPLSLGIALLFYLTDLPAMPADQRWISFLAAMQYGLVIYASFFLFYALMWAWLTYDSIRNGKMRNVGNSVYIAIGFPALTVGLWLARRGDEWITGQSLNSSSFLSAVMGGSFINLMFVFYYSYKYSQKENLQLKAASSEAKYHVLENQMKPHFLFNSLNSLSELIAENPGRASEMAQKLADLYREILANSKLKTASLASELAIVDKYLQLEKIRFGQRLEVELPSALKCEPIYLPSLILQTLAENSIKHGIAHSVSGGHVKINVQTQDHGYKISVINSAEEPPKQTSNSGTGLSNTRTRLDLLYGERHGFTLEHCQGQTSACFMVTGEEIP